MGCGAHWRLFYRDQVAALMILRLGVIMDNNIHFVRFVKPRCGGGRLQERRNVGSNRAGDDMPRKSFACRYGIRRGKRSGEASGRLCSYQRDGGQVRAVFPEDAPHCPDPLACGGMARDIPREPK